MNKFQKLAQLNQDIELLENAGKFEAAEILQKKFVKEAQVANMYNNPTLNNDIKLNRYQNYQTPQAPQSSATTNMYNDPALNKDIKLNRYQEYQTPQDNTAPQSAPNTLSQPQGTSGDTSNDMQANNSMPAESPIYQQAINQIAKLLNTKMPENRDKAQQIYENTIGQFKDPKRKQLFAKQFQAIVSRNFPAGKLN